MSILDDAVYACFANLPREQVEELLQAWRKENPGIVTAWEGAGKPSKCCPGELLVPMHSTDTKLCTGCKVEHPWNLEPGQKRTFN